MLRNRLASTFSGDDVPNRKEGGIVLLYAAKINYANLFGLF